MPSQFVLRDENTTDNPFVARMYGLGITAGKNILYQQLNSRTVFLSLLMEGARFVGDLGCSKAIKVFYAGFELAEFDGTGARQWKFHKGTIAPAPQYKAIQAIDVSSNILSCNGHGYTTGDLVAFWKRGADVYIPVTGGAGILPVQTKLMVWVVSSSTIKILNQTTGTPTEANAIDFLATPTNVDRLFIYKANSWVFDANQGRPDFFQDLNFTFSGYSYLEVHLPVNLSDGENEPSNLKVLVEGKEMYIIQNVAGNVAFSSTVSAEPNNANISADVLVHDGKLAPSRLHGASWVAWKDRCDALIPWTAGNALPAPRASYPTLINMTYNSSLNKLTASGGSGGYAFTELFTSKYPSIEAKYMGGGLTLAFTNDNTGGGTSTQGLRVDPTNNMMKYYHPGGVESDIVTVAVGDRLKVTYENGLTRIYKNSIPMPAVSTSQLQVYQSYYCKITMPTAGGTVEDIYIAPSGTNQQPRQVKRFEGGFAAAQPLPAADVLEAMVHLSPGSSWADIDGQVQVCSEPDRTPCFTFIHAPDDPDIQSNINKITVIRKDPRDIPNYYRFTFRDKDDPILTRKPSPIDRESRRKMQGGRLIDGGLLPYGVMTQSLMERVGETHARLNTDLASGFVIEAYADSIAVVKGSFVYVICPETGYTQRNPALCMVNEMAISPKDVETIVYTLTVITPNWYSDVTVIPTTPPFGGSTAIPMSPPPAAADMSLSQTTEPAPDGSDVASITGIVTFGDAVNQHARIFQKVLINKIGNATYNSSTNVFTLSGGVGGMPVATQPLSLGSTADDVPAGYSHEGPYYMVNISGTTFKLSRTVSGTPDTFTTNGSGLELYEFAPWTDTMIDVVPPPINVQAPQTSPSAPTAPPAGVITDSGVMVTDAGIPVTEDT